MTPEQRPEVVQVDREAAADLIERYWSGNGEEQQKMQLLAASYRMGHSQGVWAQAFARHRIAAEKAALDRVLTAVRRAGERIGGVEIDAMNGDNLAVTLCTHFDDAEGEQDDNGWTKVATIGCDQTLKAIHACYEEAIRASHPERRSENG